MSVESFIRAIPKVELHVHLEGGVGKQALLTIADQNEIGYSVKHFDDWVKQLSNPNYERLDDLIRVTQSWLRIPEDLTRAVYDLGTSLAKQNVRYAEVSVNPNLYPEMNLTVEQFVQAINDGRDRANRAWGIHMSWIIAVPRDEPRKADDLARWASTISARRAGVVALGLVGKESVQPVGQFERAFRAAEKKSLARVPHAGEMQGADAVIKTIQSLLPNRIADGWGIAESRDALDLLHERQISVDVSLVRPLCLKKIENYADYPLRQLYDDGIILTVGSDMPEFFKTTLSDQYLAVVNKCGFSVEELEEIALNAVRTSLMPDEDKKKMLDEFQQEYQRLRSEHITPQTT